MQTTDFQLPIYTVNKWQDNFSSSLSKSYSGVLFRSFFCGNNCVGRNLKITGFWGTEWHIRHLKRWTLTKRQDWNLIKTD